MIDSLNVVDAKYNFRSNLERLFLSSSLIFRLFPVVNKYIFMYVILRYVIVRKTRLIYLLTRLISNWEKINCWEISLRHEIFISGFISSKANKSFYLRHIRAHSKPKTSLLEKQILRDTEKNNSDIIAKIHIFV